MTEFARKLAMVAVAGGLAAAFTVGPTLDATASTSSLCKDYAALGNIHGTKVADLKAAARAYSKLAGEAPANARADLKFLAAAELKVANGHAASVDNKAASAAARRADVVLAAKCRGQG